ncbi:alcohol oxidase [Mycena epipterygia]|nr:alcohol oxidase [Mycena epipterygia]
MILPAAQISGKTFDYIVIGGGTSGLTIATRLSEDPSLSVLVIEAGPANLDDPDILTPAALATHFGKPNYDWAFQTVSQPLCHERVLTFNRGKCLGGSSAINFFQYHRPPKSDIDAFEALGNKGWNWDLLSQYYAKSEHFVEPKIKTDAMSYDLSYHGLKGPLTTAYPNAMTNFEIPYQMALKSVGVDLVKEPFSGDICGTWITPITVCPNQRVRSYSANKYYQPNASRKNLVVVVSAHVTKILTEMNVQDFATAVGVEFLHDNTSYTAKVRKEVILSAGAIMSPQILELSGIGDTEILNDAGIEPRVHLPGVGNNVQEHVYAGVTREIQPDLLAEYHSLDALRDPQERVRQQELYKTSGTGVFGMSPSCMAFLPFTSISGVLEDKFTRNSKEQTRSPSENAGLEKQYQVQLQHIKNEEPNCEFVLSPRFIVGPNPAPPGKQHITIATFINHPFSRGTIHVASSDPLVQPKIDPHYFGHEYDILAFVEQLKFCRRILDQEPLKRLLTETEVNPGPEIQTDDQISEYLKLFFGTSWHTVGSCSMLPLADGGVVDNNLKVYLTTNIRVIDVSIIPLHLGAHLQATAYALGELGADLITGKKLPLA